MKGMKSLGRTLDPDLYSIVCQLESSSAPSLVRRPSLHVGEKESGVLSDFSCHSSLI